MRIDLHTHSDRSDGTDSPTELVRGARAAGLDVVALTDHDTTRGWTEAAREAARVGVRLVRGIEVSTRFRGQGVHLLAYLPDPVHEGLQQELTRVLDGRNARLPQILARLADLGLEVTEEEVRALSDEAVATGRPHIADAMVARGMVADRDEAFARYLGPGCPAYVDRYAADLEGMIATIADAGGVSVVAHPWARRHRHDALDLDGIAGLQARGLAGIEVDHEDHDRATRSRLCAVAEELDLVRTGSSDYHGTGKVGHALGCNTTDPEQFERLMSLAGAAARASGRSTPGEVATAHRAGS